MRHRRTRQLPRVSPDKRQQPARITDAALSHHCCDGVDLCGCFYFWKDMSLNIDRKFQVIYADPPWSYDDKCLHRGGAERHYSTMAMADIQEMPVTAIADTDCVLFMWATFPKLAEAFDVIRSWDSLTKRVRSCGLKPTAAQIRISFHSYHLTVLIHLWGWGVGRGAMQKFACWPPKENRKGKAAAFIKSSTNRLTDTARSHKRFGIALLNYVVMCRVLNCSPDNKWRAGAFGEMRFPTHQRKV